MLFLSSLGLRVVEQTSLMVRGREGGVALRQSTKQSKMRIVHFQWRIVCAVNNFSIELMISRQNKTKENES